MQYGFMDGLGWTGVKDSSSDPGKEKEMQEPKEWKKQRL